MKILSIHPAARAETQEAIEHYEGQREGLGADLRTEVERAFTRLQTHPQIYPFYRRTGYRKCPVARFSYVVYFREFRDIVWIAAVSHTSRRPGYWRGRRLPG